jgi:hypothetical protein
VCIAGSGCHDELLSLMKVGKARMIRTIPEG